MIATEILYGWEPQTRYVRCEAATRGQAKARVAWDEGEPFTDMRCRRVWLVYRELTEEESAAAWLDDWYEGYCAHIACPRDAEGAEAWWEVCWSRPAEHERGHC